MSMKLGLGLEQRYESDTTFRRLVQDIYNLAYREAASGTDLRDACLMAQYLLDLQALRGLYASSQVDAKGYRSRGDSPRGFNSD